MSTDKGFTSGFGGTFGVMTAFMVIFFLVFFVVPILTCVGCGGCAMVMSSVAPDPEMIEEEMEKLERERELQNEVDLMEENSPVPLLDGTPEELGY